MGRIKVAKTRLIRIWCFGKLTMFLFVPIHNFPPGTGSWWIGTREFPRYKPHFFKINPTVGVPSTFCFAILMFQVPERYVYLSGTGKLNCIDRNFTTSGTRTCLVQMIKWKQEFRNLISGGQDSDFWNYWLEAVLETARQQSWPRWPTLNATYKIAKAIFECWYLVPGLQKFSLFIIIPSLPTPPTLTIRQFLDFWTIPNGPSIFLSTRLTGPGTLDLGPRRSSTLGPCGKRLLIHIF